MKIWAMTQDDLSLSPRMGLSECNVSGRVRVRFGPVLSSPGGNAMTIQCPKPSSNFVPTSEQRQLMYGWKPCPKAHISIIRVPVAFPATHVLRRRYIL